MIIQNPITRPIKLTLQIQLNIVVSLGVQILLELGAKMAPEARQQDKELAHGTVEWITGFANKTYNGEIYLSINYNTDLSFYF